MAYDLEGLGSSGFQDLAASMAVAVFGPAVQVMGSGRDGGRDMYVEGPLTWNDQFANEEFAVGGNAVRETGRSAQQAHLETWSGYTVFQVKHKETLGARPKDNASWLWSEVRKELDSWVTPAAGRVKVPRQLVFITNVALTPTPGSGGHDQLRRSIADYRATLSDSSWDIDGNSHDAREQRQMRLRRLARLNRIKKIKWLS